MWAIHSHLVWLIGNRRGTGHVDPGALSKAFALAGQAAGLEATLTSHCLRHSFATRLFEAAARSSTR